MHGTNQTPRVYITLNYNYTFRNFSIIVWPNNHIFQTYVEITAISKNGKESKRMKENLIYEGQLKGWGKRAGVLLVKTI